MLFNFKCSQFLYGKLEFIYKGLNPGFLPLVCPKTGLQLSKKSEKAHIKQLTDCLTPDSKYALCISVLQIRVQFGTSVFLNVLRILVCAETKNGCT